MTELSTLLSDPLCPIFVDDAEALAEWERILVEIRESVRVEEVPHSSDKRGQQLARKADTRHAMPCPECGYPIDTGAIYCKFCRTILAADSLSLQEETVDHAAFR